MNDENRIEQQWLTLRCRGFYAPVHVRYVHTPVMIVTVGGSEVYTLSPFAPQAEEIVSRIEVLGTRFAQDIRKPITLVDLAIEGTPRVIQCLPEFLARDRAR